MDHEEFLGYGAACDSCHHGVTATPPSIDDDHCLSCHVFGMDEWTTTEEMHRVHTIGKHKVECFECHGWIRHGPTAQAMSISQFDCTNCHADQHRIQRGTYARVEAEFLSGESAPEISPMFLSHVGCPSCHIKPRPVAANPGTGATVAYAVPEACDACHNPGFGARMIPLWQGTTRELYDSVAGLLPKNGFVAAIADDDTKALVDDARRLLDLVRLDGSWGVHNPAFTERLIEEARDKLVRARGLTEDLHKDGGR